MPITFHCVHCGQHISIATRMAGVEVACPTCQAALVVPASEPTTTEPPAPEQSSVPEQDSGSTARPAWMAAHGPQQDVPPEQNVDPKAVETLAPDDSDEVPPWELPPIDESFFESDDEVPEPSSPSIDRPRRVRSRRRRPGGDDEEMDLTSMVDVTFLLLVFFMITASFTRQKSFEVPPPDPEKKGAAQLPQFLEDIAEVSIRVAIDAENHVTVDDEPVPDTATLGPMFVELGRDRTELLLESDEAALHETVVLVLDAAQDAGLQRIRMTMARSDGGE